MDNFVIRHKEGGYGTLRNGKLTRVSHLPAAQRFTYDRAQSALKNNVNANFRNCWEIVNEVDCMAFPAPEPIPVEEPPKVIEGEFNWEDVTSAQQKLFKSLFTYRDQCLDDLRAVELEITDIQHYIEFFALDASKGYKAYKMLHERLTRRRFLKDEIAKANFVLSGDASAFSTGKVSKQVQQMEQRLYSPRILMELFGTDSGFTLTAAG